jgi:hypothetical protein
MSRLLVCTTLALATLLLTNGCARAAVVQGQPRPNIDLPDQGTSLTLVIDEAVKDQFEAEVNGKLTVNVSEWLATLKNGFHAGFDPAFRTNTDKADLTLQLSEAVLSFAPTAVGRYGSVAAAEAQVRYKARLVDAQGQVLRRSNGTVTSKRSVTQAEEITNISAGAVESMYEKIAQDFFSQPPAATPEPTPAQ